MKKDMNAFFKICDNGHNAINIIEQVCKTCIIFINQLREKIGVMFGNPEVTAGGKALKFYASVRIDVRKSDALKDSNGAYGSHTKAKIVKNKVAPPFKTAEFDIIFGKGISHGSCLVDLGTEYGVISKSGSWFSYNGEKIAQGREKAIDYLENNAEIADEIKNKIMEAFRNNSK